MQNITYETTLCFIFSCFYLEKALTNLIQWYKMNYQKAEGDY